MTVPELTSHSGLLEVFNDSMYLASPVSASHKKDSNIYLKMKECLVQTLIYFVCRRLVVRCTRTFLLHTTGT